MPTSALIKASELAALLNQDNDNILLVDCSYALTDPAAGAQTYSQGHIPGAVHADLGTLLSQPGNGTNGRHPLPDPQVFADGMAALGANSNSLIIAYDAEDSMFAARLWWLLRWIGHDKVRVLDGGLRAWTEAGGELSTVVPRPERGSLNARPQNSLMTHYAEVLANVESRQRQVLDARAADRFRGENETLDPVGGHIPGALNRPYKENLDAQGRFKTADILRKEFQALLGNTPAQQVIHQCGSGVSACHNLLAMEAAGLTGGILYPGSWSEWCHQPDAPVARD
ncbi:MAG: sulfurtransferase [Alcaligenaceae bacterium]|nr:sulfurtransferase [Alcaligenaceae bacterium]